MNSEEMDDLIVFVAGREYAEFFRQANHEPELDRKTFHKGYDAALWQITYWSKQRPKRQTMFKK